MKIKKKELERLEEQLDILRSKNEGLMTQNAVLRARIAMLEVQNTHADRWEPLPDGFFPPWPSFHPPAPLYVQEDTSQINKPEVMGPSC